MTFYKKYRIDITNRDFDCFFYREKVLNNKPVDKVKILYEHKSTGRLLSALNSNKIFDNLKIKDCLALRLANVILSRLNFIDYRAVQGCSFDEGFYVSLVNDLLENGEVVADQELFIVYLKQTVHILRENGIIANVSGFVKVADSSMSRRTLYKRMVRSFWDVVDWREIFPSSPELAEKIYKNRHCFIELLLEYFTEVRADDFASDFIEITGISKKDDQFIISFIGFYLFNWLKNFGIIDYNFSKSGDDFYVSIDDYGRSIIFSFLY